MSNQDPISNMLTSIRNAQQSGLNKITVPFSTVKMKILKVLKDEGFITDFMDVDVRENIKSIVIDLKYFHGAPVIEFILRVSKPSLRRYISAANIRPIKRFGVQIISTSKGIMTHLQAKKLNVGGEVICEVA